MIHHISIDAQEPLRVASVLAEILKGKVYKFLTPGSYIVLPFDTYGTHIVVFAEGAKWSPGEESEAAKVISGLPIHLAASHVAISVPATQQLIEHIGLREGWRVLTRTGKDVYFSAIELWLENRTLFELFPTEFVDEYVHAMQPEMIEQLLGQPLELLSPIAAG
jgi:hypothetical protein